MSEPLREDRAHALSIPRLVVDTNLFVGLLFRPESPGPRGIWEAVLSGRARLVLSPPVLRELRATFRRLPVESARKREILDRLEDPSLVECREAVEDSGFRCADPEDDKFLHLALAADADALVTSDRALLAVEGFPVPILKSGQWLRRHGREQE
jgi:putative PIN family toxin of toxin-antitoxin system